MGPEPFFDTFTTQFTFNNDNYRGFPKMWAVKDVLAHGQFPLWNIYEGGGVDIFGISGVRFFSLFLLRFFSPVDTVVLIGTLQTFFLMLFFYLFARQLRLSARASLLGAMVWSYSGYHIWNLYDLVLTGNDLWLPFLLYCYLRLQKSPNPLFWIATMAGAIGLQALNARPSDFVYNMIIFGGVTLLLLIDGRLQLPKNWSHVLRWIFANIIMLTLGLALAAVLILPVADYIVGSHRFTSNAHWIPTNYSSFSKVAELFFPSIFSKSGAMFVGLVNTPLLVIAHWHADAKLRRVAMTTMIFALLCIFPFGLFDFLRLIPPHQGALVSFRFFPALLLALGIMTAMGFDVLFNSLDKIPLSLRNKLFRDLPIRWGLPLLGIFFIITFFKVHFWSATVVLLASIIALLLIHSALGKNRRELLLPILVAAMLSGYYVANQGDISDGDDRARYDDYFNSQNHDELMSFLQKELKKEPFRVYSFHRAFRYPSIFTKYGIPTIFNYEASPPQRTLDIQLEMKKGAMPFAFFDISNVRYLIGRKKVAGSDNEGTVPEWALQRYKLVGEFDDRFIVLENTGFLPKLYFASDINVIADQSEQLRWLRWQIQGMDRRSTLIDHAPPCVSSDNHPPQGRVELTEYSPNRVVINTTTAKAELLIFSDTYTTGWSAKVSGETTAIKQANYNYRAICIPPGKHEVIFTYLPKKIPIGLKVSGYALAVLCTMFLVAALSRFKNRN